ncbi:hypothetical protein [Hymenobacter setariae]|nr:hypothetical protein [Hymenobacter setariae]
MALPIYQRSFLNCRPMEYTFHQVLWYSDKEGGYRSVLDVT